MQFALILGAKKICSTPCTPYTLYYTVIAVLNVTFHSNKYYLLIYLLYNSEEINF
jgi:hypothetical protein